MALGQAGRGYGNVPKDSGAFISGSPSRLPDGCIGGFLETFARAVLPWFTMDRTLGCWGKGSKTNWRQELSESPKITALG